MQLMGKQGKEARRWLLFYLRKIKIIEGSVYRINKKCSSCFKQLIFWKVSKP